MEHIHEKGRILVVDDDNSFFEIIRSVLENDFFVLSASNGREALSILRSSSVDFIISDWDMPIMNGLELVKELKNSKEFKRIPVVMMTGYMTDRTHLLEAYSTGVIDFLKKPFDVIELKARADSIYQLAKFYKEELKSRDRELIANAIRLAEINAFLNDILSKIDDTRINISPAEFKSIINSKIADTIWDEFSNNFIKIHPNFVSNITAKHGSLTPAEIKLASLLRLNLSTKEVASLLHQNPDSIKVARARLRKKLHLDTEENLSVYLLNF